MFPPYANIDPQQSDALSDDDDGKISNLGLMLIFTKFSREPPQVW
jgi:hypothetical protein